MALLGDLLIRAGIDTSKLSKGLGKAQGYLQQFSSNILSTKNMVLGFGAAIGAGVVANGLKNLVMNQMDAIDTAGDMAQQLGITVGAVQSLGYAATMSGSDAETMNAALQKMQLNMGEAVTGSGATSEALKKLGLTYDDLSGMSLDEQFLTISGALADVSDKTEQAAIASDIFGKANLSLLNTVDAGADGIRNLQQEAYAMKVALSDVDASSVGEAKASLDKVNEIMSGIGNTIIVELSP